MSRKGLGAIVLGIGVLLSGAYSNAVHPENPDSSTYSIKTMPIQSAWWCTAFSIVCREATAERSVSAPSEGAFEESLGQKDAATEETPIVFEWKLAEWWKSHFSP